jgi:hypothetical protein
MTWSATPPQIFIVSDIAANGMELERVTLVKRR